MAAINRSMVLYVNVGEEDTAPIKHLDYTFSTLAAERDLADVLAEEAGVRLGEGHIAIIDLEDGGVLNKLACPA